MLRAFVMVNQELTTSANVHVCRINALGEQAEVFFLIDLVPRVRDSGNYFYSATKFPFGLSNILFCINNKIQMNWFYLGHNNHP